jgi:aspartyl-tRNA(Asn)/glutamyl-tRNA(Gln) amidotransferase subunit A
MCLGALGTQTGGSIIRPASYCGVCGLKPTFGRVSFAGVVGVTTHLDHAGPMARSVRDLAILFEAMAGCDPKDPLTSRQVVPNCLEAIEAGVARAPRLGRLDSYFLDEADTAIASVSNKALARLESAGASIVAGEMPASFARVREMHRRIMVVEALAMHRATFPSRRSEYGPNIASLLEEGTRVSAIEYSDALRHQKCFQHEILEAFADVDVLVMPATDSAAPTHDSTGSPKFQSPWSYAGLPEVTIPCGLTEAGLPAGLQLVGLPFQEAPLLAAAAWCEQRLGFVARPKMLD